MVSDHKRIWFDMLWFHLSVFAAVKFGRMSKKQREKVEAEVSFYRGAALRNAALAAANANGVHAQVNSTCNGQEMPDSSLGFDLVASSSTPISG